jgi:SNW domain-containing protein 1
MTEVAALRSLLPAPKQQPMDISPVNEAPLYPNAKKMEEQNKRIPAYGQRQGWVPRTPEDFGDGGAFPEIHIAQYPLNMGKKNADGSSVGSEIVSVNLSKEGKVEWDAIIKRGRSDQIIYSKHSDMMEKQFDEDTLGRPDSEMEKEATDKTRAALEKKLQTKIRATQPANADNVEREGTTKYIRYTPANQNPAHNSGADTRIIRMVEMPKDPLEPPKFKNKKVPRGPPDAPVPIMHSPSKKLTKEERDAWKIPPAISNWKNQKGFTIPLDKRLATDGRGLIEPVLNDNFAKFSQAMYIAERNARDEVAKRATLEKQKGIMERENQKDALRLAAQQARMERMEIEQDAQDDNNDREGRLEREKIMEERRREREREMRMENRGNKKAKTQRDSERDVSEKMALGQAVSRPQETLFDSRLFNQSAGMDSGFGDDEAYTVYDKPMRGGDREAALYKAPTKTDEEQYGEKDLQESLKTSKFQPDRGFEGAERASGEKSQRSGPVEFEKVQEEDVFGLDDFLHEAKTGQKKVPQRQQLGVMHASGGGSQKEDEYRGRDPRRSAVQFESKGELKSDVKPRESTRDRERRRSRSRSRSRSRERRNSRRSRSRSRSRERRRR